MWVSIPGNFDSIGLGWSNGTGPCVHLCVHVCLCFHLILRRLLILVWEYWIFYIKANVLDKEVAYWTQLHSNRCVQTQPVALFPTWGWQKGCNRERRWEGEAVCCQRGGDLEYAIMFTSTSVEWPSRGAYPPPSQLSERAEHLQWKRQKCQMCPSTPGSAKLSESKD